jgi:UDP-N-acetylglucosamine 2-epimerase (non-hydrolysing)
MHTNNRNIRVLPRVLLIMGTRPEAIKMAPIVQECQRHAGSIEPIVCFTGQHREMLAQVADYFGIRPDLDLEVMRPNQTLAALTSRCLEGIDAAVTRYQPDYVVAQGDTTTVLAASMVAFYRHTPFVHVEAGLRTGNLLSPWPEEYNRRVAGITAHLHCAPTARAASNLHAEGVDPRRVQITGNTVIDALLWTVERERRRGAMWQDKHAALGDRRVILITGHRRENFGEKFEAVCQAIAELAGTFPECAFVYPVHLNPNVREPVFRILTGYANVHLVEPASYPEFVWLMDRAYLILTDSGGVQEEAPSLKKPVLVMRDTTERPEAVEAGAVRLVGTSQRDIVHWAEVLLTQPAAYATSVIPENPYGDGLAAQRIVACLQGRQAARRLAA